MKNDVLYSSNSSEWGTPQEFFDKVNSIYHFDLDVCASNINHKCDAYYTKEDDGLSKPWHGKCWCNPPYGRAIGKWIEKAHDEAQNGCTVVMLIPARTDTKWFHNYIYQNPNCEVEFLKGRLTFINENGDRLKQAPFPSMLVTFRPNKQVSSGAYERFHCLHPHSVIWQSDFDFSDFGYEGEGIVHICHCTNCGADIEYRVPLDAEGEQTWESTRSI